MCVCVSVLMFMSLSVCEWVTEWVSVLVQESCFVRSFCNSFALAFACTHTILYLWNYGPWKDMRKTHRKTKRFWKALAVPLIFFAFGVYTKMYRINDKNGMKTTTTTATRNEKEEVVDGDNGNDNNNNSEKLRRRRRRISSSSSSKQKRNSILHGTQHIY